ncbi:hypothetical protein BJ138DRAFT_1105594 [Hygrophoropsis aurantiaca]|uniref:Uncharacterized protein n=1 Tax=Hygrophoropsis aurantiaca TaxID=72124 RepID=A0ACB7ZYW0_9AGAM|nr:hypothetical protein BJ138DRAFT_1105594 [Hygrophoropsis aurantiaca]
MPFFQNAQNVDASHGTFNDIAGDQTNTVTTGPIVTAASYNTSTKTNTNSHNNSSVTQSAGGKIFGLCCAYEMNECILTKGGVYMRGGLSIVESISVDFGVAFVIFCRQTLASQEMAMNWAQPKEGNGNYTENAELCKRKIWASGVAVHFKLLTNDYQRPLPNVLLQHAAVDLAVILLMSHHSSLYLSDGNVVLSAPNSSGHHVLFRVHRSLLAKHSSVLETMFDLPCDASTNETYDEVPLVIMHDSAEDLATLLEIMYGERHLSFQRLDPETPNIHKSVLSLSTKYGMDRMRNHIVSLLERDWPQTLWHWDSLEDEIDRLICTWDDSGSPTHPDSRLDDYFPEPAAAICLAREFSVPSILPAAFYHLSRLSIRDDWASTRRCPSSDPGAQWQRTAKWELLPSEDLICLLSGREKLKGFAAEILGLEGFPSDAHEDIECEPLALRVFLQKIYEACGDTNDILAVLRRFAEGRSQLDPKKLCFLCRDMVQDQTKDLRTRIWTELAEVFCKGGFDE